MNNIKKVIEERGNRIQRKQKRNLYFPVGEDWERFCSRTFTAEEIAQADFKAALLDEIIEIRYEKDILRRALKEFARLERDQIDRRPAGTF